MPTTNYGLIIKPAKPHQWVMGSGKATAKLGADAGKLHPSADWWQFDSDKELQQKNGLETMNCTVFGTLLALQAVARKKGYAFFPQNGSDRALGIACETTPNGNDPWKVAEYIATRFGVVPEEVLPWTDDIYLWEQYYAPKPLPKDIVALGESLLRKVEIEPEWVIPPMSSYSAKQKADRIAEALTRSAVCGSVHAWNKKDGVYVKNGEPDNHWVWIPKLGEARDQYKPFKKKLEKHYDHDIAIVYFMRINESGVLPKDKPLAIRIIRELIRLYKKLLP